MATKFKATKEFQMNHSGNSRTLEMVYTRTFNNEDAAVERLMEWQKELEEQGWSIRKITDTEIRMTKVNHRNVTSYAKLYIA